MSTKTDAVTGAAIKRAIEGRDGRMLASFYADDAVLRVTATIRRASRAKSKASRRSARSGTTSAAGR
jgi:ketosteroid isomerase-like protein